MAKFFGYKGYISVNGFSDKFLNRTEEEIEAEGEEDLELSDLSSALENNPLECGQLGLVYDMNKCQFNQEAIDILLRVEKSRDDIGDVDFFRAGEKNICAVIGGPMMLLSSEAEGSNSYDYDLIKSIVPTELEIPQDLKDHIDSLGEE